MKLYVNRFPINGPWGGGNMLTKALHEWLPQQGHEVIPAESMTVAPDVILLTGLDNDGHGGISAEQAISYKMLMEAHGRDVKLVLRVNENDARKGTAHVDSYLMKLFPHMDGIVFVSDWLHRYFAEKGWSGGNCKVIYNGVDQSVFKRLDATPNNLNNIVAHHWSDNYMKGFDIYEKLDEWIDKNPGFTFTYIGRDRGTFKNTKVIKPLSGKRLGEELGKYDVYVSASRFDPGPNHILEALACGMPTFVHKDGGGCVEFAGADHAYSNWDELEALLVAGAWNGNSNAIRLSSWQTCVQEYSTFLEQTVKSVVPSASE